MPLASYGFPGEAFDFRRWRLGSRLVAGHGRDTGL